MFALRAVGSFNPSSGITAFRTREAQALLRRLREVGFNPSSGITAFRTRWFYGKGLGVVLVSIPLQGLQPFGQKSPGLLGGVAEFCFNPSSGITAFRTQLELGGKWVAF